MEISKINMSNSSNEMQIHMLREKLPVLFYEFSVDKGGGTYSCQCSTILGYEMKDFEENPFLWHDSIHKEDLAEVDEAILRAISDEDQIDIQYRIIDSDGNVHWFLDRADVILDQNGEKKIFGVAVDITEQKSTEIKLEQALQQKDILLKELNHRVKNNLFMISSIIDLKKTHDISDLSNIKTHIDAIGTIHEMLYLNEDVSAINLSEYIQKLVNIIIKTITNIPVKFINKIEDIQIPYSLIIPIGLIVNEITTNAIKHSFSNIPKPEFIVSTDWVGNNIKLTLENNGTSISKEIDFDNTGTIGISLLSALVKQLSGSMNIQRSPHPAFILEFNPGLN